MHQLQKEFAQYCKNPLDYHKPILAGGAIRDDYMQKPYYINDYDIFIPLLDGVSDDTILKIIQRVFPRADTCEQLFDSDYLTLQEQYDSKSDVKPGAHSEIGAVWEVDEHGLTYQLVFTKNDPIDHVNKYFDFGICKAYCDGVKLHYSADFMRDVKNKTLTLVGQGMSEEQIQYAIFVHAERIRYKYNYQIIIPPEYQKFVKDKKFQTF